MTEQELQKIIKSIQLGNDNAFKDIIIRYRKDCLKFLIKTYGLSLEESEEITSDSLFIVFKKLKFGEFEFKDKNSIKNYLFKICSNAFIESYRKRKRRERLFEKANPEDWHDNQHINSLSDKELMDLAIRKALPLLKGKNCGAIIELRYFEKMDLIQIADLLNYANNKVLSEKHKRCITELTKKALKIYEQLRNDQIL